MQYSCIKIKVFGFLIIEISIEISDYFNTLIIKLTLNLRTVAGASEYKVLYMGRSIRLYKLSIGNSIYVFFKFVLGLSYR